MRSKQVSLDRTRMRLIELHLNNLVSFIVWPFGTLVWSLKHLCSHQSKYLFFLFCVYFGFVFILPQELIGSRDSEMYALQFLEMHENQTDFWDFIKGFYSIYEGYVDVLQPLLTWILAQFTGSTRVLFTVFGAFFGYFFTQNLWIIFDRLSENYKPNSLLLLVISLLFLLNPIWNINGFRFYFASHIFLYGILKLFMVGNKKGWIWILLSALVHFSFVALIVIGFIFVFIPKKHSILLIFFYLTFLVSSVDLNLVQKVLPFLPINFIQKVEFYTNPDYARIVGEKEWALHIILARWSAKILGLIWISILYFFRKEWLKVVPQYAKLFTFILLLGGAVQLMNLIPSGIRFYTVFNFILMGFVLIVLSFSEFYHKVRFFCILLCPIYDINYS